MNSCGPMQRKVVCLAIGNVSNAITASCLLSHADAIADFVNHPETGFLLLALDVALNQ